MNFKGLIERLNKYSQNRIVMVGLGNPIRRDDAAGLELLTQIREQNIFKSSNLIFANTTPENYVGKIVSLQPEIVVFIDAVKMSKNPGTICEIPSESVDNKGFSTHSYSIKMIEDYLNNENIDSFMYIGIEPESMEIGESLTGSVRSGIEAFFN